MFEMCIVPLDEELGAINKWTLELCGLWAVFLFQDEYNTHSKYQATCSCCCFLFLSCQGQINVIEFKYNISIWNVVEQKYKAASVFNAQSPSASKFQNSTAVTSDIPPDNNLTWDQSFFKLHLWESCFKNCLGSLEKMHLIIWIPPLSGVSP